MAGTGETGGLSGLALGGAVAAVVVVGGATMAWLGLFNGGGNAPVPRDEAANSVAISPSATPPVVIEGVSQQPDPVVAAPTALEVEAVAPEPSSEPSPETGSQEMDQVEAAETSQEEVRADNEADAPAAAGAENAASAGGTETAETAENDSTDSATSLDTDASVAQGAAAEATDISPQDSSAVGQTSADLEDGAEVALFDAPLLDLVRVGPSGETVIAGRATEGLLVEILVDGEVVEQAEVQPGGDFVAFADLPPSSQPRVISLRASAQGQERLSDSSFIVAPASPLPAASVVASAPEETSAPEQPLSEEIVQSEAQELAEGTVPSTEAASDDREERASVQAETEGEGAATVASAMAETALDTSDAEQDTLVAKAPEGVATDAPEPTEPATAVTSPEAGAAADTATARAEPMATSPGPAEDTTEVVTQPAPQPQPAQVAVLRADADGVTLVQPVAQKPQGKVVLDTISYSDRGEVQLAGRAGAASGVLVYLDNAPAAQFTAQENGSWGGRLEAVEPGVYTLRLDEVDAAGKVLSRLETPFKREAPEVLQPPVSEGATGEAAPLVRAVTVQEGDTLWAISQQRYGSGFLFVRVFEANQDAIRDPDLIYPGQVFALPE